MSPLAFLIIAEALTRLIQNDPSIKGIEISGINIKISQFADDTQLFAETYEKFLIALEWVEIYEQATGRKSTRTSTSVFNGAPTRERPLHPVSTNTIGSSQANTQRS
jgi:hypothetical protein